MPTVYNKVTINGTPYIDLSQDTVADASHIRQGYTGHLNDGTQVTGTFAGGVDCPTFYVTFDNNNNITSVTCDKTYNQCHEYLNNYIDFACLRLNIEENILALVNTVAAQDSLTYSAVDMRYGGIEIVYSALNGLSGSIVEIPYHDESSDVTVSGQTVTIPYGYYPSQITKSIASGTVTAPSSISGTSATVSTGTNTLTLTKSVSVTPTVSTAGYVSSGTAGNSSVSLTASVTTKAAATITPSTSNQTIAAGTYLTGAQTISGDANLIAGNIAQGKTIFGVQGSYTGGGGSGIGTLLNTTSIGSVSSSSTQAASLNVSLSVSGINSYDLLIVESSVNSVTNGRHTATVGLIYLTASSGVGTKDGATIATAKWNSKASSNGTKTTSASTTAYGIYPNSCSISSGTASIPMYRRYNSTSTGTINGTYTARVYGVKLHDLIGG